MKEEQHQAQIPVRRINIPVNLREGRKRSAKSGYGTVIDECPECQEQRNVLHYTAKGCIPVIRHGCSCPTRYDCPKEEQLNTTG